VSNNPYVMGASLEASQRRMIDSGQLGVVAVSSSTGSEAARLMTLSAVGQRSRSPFWHEFAAPEFEVRSRSGLAFAGIDGEALELDTPLRFRIHPGGLRLLVPEGNHEVVERRRAGDVDLRSLLLVAGGRDPGDAA
jgi:diacylglycerol kinase family enzyme